MVGLFACVLSLAYGGAAHSDEPTLSLPALLEEARAENPEVRAAHERSTVMASMPAQVRAWDDPTVSYEAWNAPNSFRVDRADNNIFRFSQRIPFPGKRALAGEVAAHEAGQSTFDSKAIELDVTTAVKRAYFDLWLAYERLAVLQREKLLVERLTHVVEGRYGTSEATQADVLRAQVELTHLVNGLQTQELAIETAHAELAALLSRPKESVRGRPEGIASPVLKVSVDDVVLEALQNRPEVQAQEQAIAREESAVKLAERNRLPDFEVSVGRFVNNDARDGFGGMVSMTLPIFNGAKYASGIDEANARLRVAKAERQRLENLIRREVEQAYLRAKTALLQYELFTKTHIPQAEQARRVTESGYQAGDVPFLDVIDTFRSIESVHLEHVMAQAEFEKAYADLERAAGEDLPRASTGARGQTRGAHE